MTNTRFRLGGFAQCIFVFWRLYVCNSET